MSEESDCEALIVCACGEGFAAERLEQKRSARMRTRRRGRWLPKQPRLGARMCQGTFFLSYRKLRFHTIKTLREDRTAAEWKNVACATRCRRRILLRRILFHASDLEYAFFIWLLSSNSTLSSVSSVSFCSIAAISAFACCRSAFLTAGSCSAAKRAS